LFKGCEKSGYKLLRYPLGDNANLGFTVKKDDDIVIFTNSCSRLSREIFTLGGADKKLDSQWALKGAESTCIHRKKLMLH
jgi:hypothetical protein